MFRGPIVQALVLATLATGFGSSYAQQWAPKAPAAAAVAPHIKAGKLKALAIASAKRSALLPDLPTMTELGFPDVKADAWIGFVAPAKTPAPVVQRLQAEIVQVLAEPAVKEKLLSQSMEAVGNTPAEFRSTIASEVARWKPVIEKHKITLD